MKIGGKNVSVLMVAVLAIAAYFLAGEWGMLPATVFPLTGDAIVGEPFGLRFFTGGSLIAGTANCEIDPTGDAFIIQQITVHESVTGTTYDQLPVNGYPQCAAFSYQWPDFYYTPTLGSQYIITSTVRDGTNDNVLETDIFTITATEELPNCNPGDTMCDYGSSPSRILTCSADGHYTIWGDFCPAGCTDPGNGDAYCNQVCTPGSYQCVGQAQYQYCDADGLGWGATETCGYTWPLPTSCIDGQATPCHQAPAVCGDGICSEGETATSCPPDCATADVCGDGVCQASESESSCPVDCDICWTDPADMDLETLCGCFPDLPNCQSQQTDDYIYTLMIVGGLVVVGMGVYLLFIRKRKR